jgi:hypothetical protein
MAHFTAKYSGEGAAGNPDTMIEGETPDVVLARARAAEQRSPRRQLARILASKGVIIWENTWKTRTAAYKEAFGN